MTPREGDSYRSRMKTFNALAIAFVALASSGTAHALTPIRVWTYGDGETSRMLSEINYLNVPATTKITIVDRSEIGSGPIGNPATGGVDLVYRIYADLVATPPSNYPHVIHIGYNASAASYAFCNALADWPEREAAAIKTAADFVASLNIGIKVLLSKGPGVPAASVGAPNMSCLQGAFDRVTWYLAYYAGTYDWVDYSGYTPGAGYPGYPNSTTIPPESLQLLKSVGGYWEADHVHVSCDVGHHPLGGCILVANETARKKLGAWRVASTVLKAYKYLQGLL